MFLKTLLSCSLHGSIGLFMNGIKFRPGIVSLQNGLRGFLLSMMVAGAVQATPMSLVDPSLFLPDDYLIDFERINTDSNGTIFNGSTEDLRDRQWIRTEFYDQYRITFDSSYQPSTSTYKPNELGTYRGATATDYPRDVFYSWAGMGFFGAGTSNYDPSTGSWGYGALSNLNNQNQNGGWIDIFFDNPVTRFGFNFVTGSTSLKIQVNGQTLSFNNSTPWSLTRFAGVFDLEGFEHVRVYSNGGGAFLLDNVRWEGGTIPEPSSMILLSLGAAALIRKRSHQKRHHPLGLS